MAFALWLIMGGAVGGIASLTMGTDERQGIALNVAVGIIGAFIGGSVFAPMLETGPVGGGISEMSYVVSVVGAVLSLTILRLFHRYYVP